MAGLWGIDLEQQTTNPLFLGGAALLSGEGFGGAMRGMQLGNQFAQQRRQQQEADAQKARWEQYASGGMGGLDPKMAELVRAAGPQGMQFAQQYMLKQPEMALEREKMKETQRFHNTQIWNMEQQRRLQEDEVRRRNQTADFQNQIMKNLLSGNQPQASPPSADPNVRPQSFGGGEPDPMLIPTQAATPAQPQAQGQGEPMIDTPYGRMTAGKARQTAGAMMMIPHMATAGKALMDSIPSDKLGKDANNDIEKTMIGQLDILGRLNSIKQGFKPEFQTIENRMGYAWTAMLDKFKQGQAVVTPEQRAELEAFSAYRSDAVDNLNQYIKFITGAAMSNAEADRILKGMPNAGTGIFDGDGPAEFQSKLNSAIKRTQMAIARQNYLRTQGLGNISADAAAIKLPINEMPKIYDQRGAQIERQIRAQNPQIDDGLLRQQTRFLLKQEFGI